MVLGQPKESNPTRFVSILHGSLQFRFTSGPFGSSRVNSLSVRLTSRQFQSLLPSDLAMSIRFPFELNQLHSVPYQAGSDRLRSPPAQFFSYRIRSSPSLLGSCPIISHSGQIQSHHAWSLPNRIKSDRLTSPSNRVGSPPCASTSARAAPTPTGSLSTRLVPNPVHFGSRPARSPPYQDRIS